MLRRCDRLPTTLPHSPYGAYNAAGTLTHTTLHTNSKWCLFFTPPNIVTYCFKYLQILQYLRWKSKAVSMPPSFNTNLWLSGRISASFQAILTLLLAAHPSVGQSQPGSCQMQSSIPAGRKGKNGILISLLGLSITNFQDNIPNLTTMLVMSVRKCASYLAIFLNISRILFSLSYHLFICYETN